MCCSNFHFYRLKRRERERENSFRKNEATSHPQILFRTRSHQTKFNSPPLAKGKLLCFVLIKQKFSTNQINFARVVPSSVPDLAFLLGTSPEKVNLFLIKAFHSLFNIRSSHNCRSQSTPAMMIGFYSVLWVFLVLLCPCIVLSNISILSVWIRYKRLRTPSNILIVSLSACDLGIGLLIPSFLVIDLSIQDSGQGSPGLISHDGRNVSSENSTVVYLDDPGGMPACENTVVCFHLLVILILSAMSLLSIGSIAVDRFLSVSEPLRYNHFVTMNTVYRFLFAAWVYSFLVYSLPVLFLEDFNTEILILYSTIFVYVPCLLLVMGSYSYIYVIARSHAKQIFSVEISLHDIGVREIPQSVVTQTPGHHRYGLTLNLLVCGLLCWAPLHALAAVDVLGDSSFLYQRHWRLLTIAPIGLSILANPWLYAYRSSEVS